MMKSWNVKEVTLEAEERISQLMAEAARIGSSKEAEDLRQRAHGIYIMWDALTLGWRNDGEGARMQRLLGPYTFDWRSEMRLPADA